ncbi:glycosyltransferase family 2 protein [Neorhizobium sp. Rsf11]|uniref:Glycosyltransferase family 2 protein n=2 Tax=Neorhizobium TaxID=1525371 RepID=A0ABV0MCR8_9HYPH|nr:glycosyltransferase family 2 protein [Neorhizobium petrolearium]WGI66939.1 glycosyltransferase family 2 protein [Neorhizobium petrolearium]
MSTFVHQPDVSFVIAAYNAEDTIERAIASALAQIGVTMEVIVIDDCSTDGTRERVRALADDRVRLIVQERNGGPAVARNAGLLVARGRWIAILDADDTVYPARLLMMLERAEAAEAQIVVDNIDVIPIEGGKPQTMFPREELTRRPLMTLADFIGSNVIFRSTFNFGYMKPVYERDFLERHGLLFDETLRIGEDYLLLASALASGGECAIMPDVGYVYHLRQGSISRVLEQHHLDAMLASDRAFLSRYTLDEKAMAAQRRRTRSLVEAGAFLTLVEDIKKGSVRGFLKTAIGNPRALRHLRMPIAVRMRRLLGNGWRQLKSDRIGRGRPRERTKEWI